MPLGMSLLPLCALLLLLLSLQAAYSAVAPADGLSIDADGSFQRSARASPFKVAAVEGDVEGTKREWPELLGKTVDFAKEAIAKERPDVEVQVHGYTAMLTQDFVPKRVRIFTLGETVARVPHVG